MTQASESHGPPMTQQSQSYVPPFTQQSQSNVGEPNLNLTENDTMMVTLWKTFGYYDNTYGGWTMGNPNHTTSGGTSVGQTIMQREQAHLTGKSPHQPRTVTSRGEKLLFSSKPK